MARRRPDRVDRGLNGRERLHGRVGVGAAQHVAHLADVPRELEPDASAVELLGQLGEHLRSGQVDERDGLRVEHDRLRPLPRVRLDVLPDRVGIGEEETALDPEHDDPLDLAGLVAFGRPSPRRDSRGCDPVDV